MYTHICILYIVCMNTAAQHDILLQKSQLCIPSPADDSTDHCHKNGPQQDKDGGTYNSDDNCNVTSYYHCWHWNCRGEHWKERK